MYVVFCGRRRFTGAARSCIGPLHWSQHQYADKLLRPACWLQLVPRSPTMEWSFLARSSRHLHMKLLLARTLSISILLILPSLTGYARQDGLALVGATVVPVSSNEIIENAVILIRDGRIIHVGEDGSAPVPAEFAVRQVKGKWIIPGIIDTNVHLILTTVPEFYVRYEESLVDIAIQSAQVGLKYGMTTMADSWGPLEPLLEARDRIRSGEVAGSDVLVAGNIIGTGGPFSPYFMDGWDLRGKSLRYGGWVTPVIKNRINGLWEAGMGPELMALTPEELAGRMREYLERGVDFVKLGISGHGIEPVEPILFTDAQLDAMVAVINEADVPFQTHTFSIASLDKAIRLKPDLLQHPNVMYPSWLGASDLQKRAIKGQIDRISRDGILSGLMAIPEKRQIEIYQSWTSGQTTDPALDEIMRFRQPWFEGVSYDALAAGLAVWLESGIPVTLATDQGPEDNDLGPTVWGRMGRAHFDRMTGLQDAGVDPLDILRAATLHGAKAYRLDGDRGSIEIGKRADLVVLTADPLQDIRHVRLIDMVIQKGRIVDREALPEHPVLDYDPELPWPY